MGSTVVLYHGTDKVLLQPTWNKGSRYRDFGQCFYTTYNRDMAVDWAEKRFDDNYVVNRYVFDFSSADSGYLRVKRFYADEEWAKFVYNNRYNKRFNRPNYDIIIGPLADNQLKEQFNKIKTENKTFDEIAALIEYRRYKDMQICFCSDYALSFLKIIK